MPDMTGDGDDVNFRTSPALLVWQMEGALNWMNDLSMEKCICIKDKIDLRSQEGNGRCRTIRTVARNLGHSSGTTTNNI